MTTPDELANQIVTAAQCDSRLNALEFAAKLLHMWQRDIRCDEINRCALEWAAHNLRQKKNC